MSPAEAKKPRVILGLMTFGPDAATGARITDFDEYKKILDTYQARGYNEVDTARAYVGGKQETWTGNVGYKQRGLLPLATKCYPMLGGEHKPDQLRASLETSLKELQTDSVDIFYLHAPDRTVPFAETLAEVDKLYKEGKFKRLGLSNYTSFEVAEIVNTCALKGWVRPTIYQGMYNAITRNVETELLPACKRYGLDVVVYNPIAGGLLSGKIKSKDVVPEEGRFSDNTRAGAIYRARYFQDGTFNALKIIEDEIVSKHEGLTSVEVALRWLVHHSALNIKDGGNDGIIIGASSLQQLESNLTDLEKGPLPPDVLESLDKAWLACKATSGPYWHKDLKYTYDTTKVLFGE